ncbi:MAG: DUF6473 family protein [Pseudomonadota bacterium]
MAYERPGESPLDYQQCRYGSSKLLFRGPRRDTSKKYCVFIGGTETYGKYIPTPFTEIVEQELGYPCVNLGAVNGGIDAFVNDEAILALCSEAEYTVVQVMGAHNMSNRFYSVHPRRNDRFLKASTLMSTIFREVDFTEFAFTRHMLTTLRTLSPEKFVVLEQELKTAWQARMDLLLKRIESKVILLWASDRGPDDEEVGSELGVDPLFIDREMLDRVMPKLHSYIEVVTPDELKDVGTDGMLFPQMEAAAAAHVPGPAFHGLVASKLLPVLDAK